MFFRSLLYMKKHQNVGRSASASLCQQSKNSSVKAERTASTYWVGSKRSRMFYVSGQLFLKKSLRNWFKIINHKTISHSGFIDTL